ncbi:hypothetical protein AGOR_G00178190 [Albula goreensis]|uniref:G-protein coupled receptors family 1 profile domain-containing protein n=1 Tax=Albula goreensis TaxID=1534307 RepID=A0A8T3D3F9_9TELE|nr:hypothetical protein AGOR_G00178190 [Albula goreensis]
MFTVGVLGNLVAIVVLCISKKEQKETTFYTLVCGMAFTDLLGTCFTSPVVIATSLVLMSQRTRIVRAEISGQAGSGRRFPKLPTVSSAAEIQMFWLLILMTIVFLICSIPLVVRIFVNQLYGPAQISAGVKPDYRSDLMAIRFASFNPILDPWVYILCRKNLLTKCCQRVKRSVGTSREDHARQVGWMSGQRTPPSYAASNTTSYASLRIGNDKNDEEQVITRTKSFTDFTVQQTWDFDASRPNFHPFCVEQGAVIESEKSTPDVLKQAEMKPMLCSILNESPIHSAGHEVHPRYSRRHNGQLEIVTCTFNTPTSCISEKCI